MCGICACFSKHRPVDVSSILQMINEISHRGPDSQGHWISPNRMAGLAHARLSIIDLISGDQPISNEFNNVHIIVNGEFYDYERIRADLIQLGHVFQTQSDSEIALHLYEEYGTNCLQYLRGEFAFVIWDSRSQTLFAARDRFGIKPLYYSMYQETLYLASEAKALFKVGVPAAWDRETFLLAQGFILPSERSIFDGIHQVPPGHFLLVSPGQRQTICYWDFDYPRIASGCPERPEAETIGMFKQSLIESIRLRLRADVPVACYLSGGLDSCAILGLASTLSSRKLGDSRWSLTILIMTRVHSQGGWLSMQQLISSRLRLRVRTWPIISRLLSGILRRFV